MATDSPTEHEMNERAEIAEAKLEALLDITKAPTTNSGWPYEKTLHDHNKALRDRIAKLRDVIYAHAPIKISNQALAADDAAEKGTK